MYSVVNLIQFTDFADHNVLIHLSVVLPGGEPQCSYYQVAFREPCLGLFAQDGGYIRVFELTSQLLQDDVALAHLASFGLLTWHLEGFALCLNSEE